MTMFHKQPSSKGNEVLGRDLLGNPNWYIYKPQSRKYSSCTINNEGQLTSQEDVGFNPLRFGKLTSCFPLKMFSLKSG
jgi:hypothetical protein